MLMSARPFPQYGVLPGYMITPDPKYELKDEICYYKKLPSHV